MRYGRQKLERQADCRAASSYALNAAGEVQSITALRRTQMLKKAKGVILVWPGKVAGLAPLSGRSLFPLIGNTIFPFCKGAGRLGDKPPYFFNALRFSNL